MGGSQHTQTYRKFLLRLREARKQAGLTQAAVAKRLGLSQGMVSKSETGERRVDIIELARFARLYRQPLDFFVPSSRL